MATNARRYLVVAAISAATAHAGAQDATMAELERTFWRCDHEAMQGLLDVGTAMDCSVFIEAFKARRFGGDFAAMLAWWRANKDAQHLALSAASAHRATAAAR